jgi:clan AA aspartic protease (TIGR02281 family)
MPTRSPDHLSYLTPEQRGEVECRIDAFKKAWSRGERPRIADSLPTDPKLRKAILLELVYIERELRIKAGELVSIESYQKDFPELAADLAKPTTLPPGETSTKSMDEPPSPATDKCPSRIGRYKIEKVLGSGGFATVFLGFDEELQRPVAVKLLATKGVAVADYLKDGRIPANFDHPNIVPVHDAGQTADGLLYVVSKYIEGTNLRARIQQKAFSAADSAELIATVAEALHYAHTRGVVHRDIKPENILIDGKGKTYVADFGIALRDEEFGKGPDNQLIGTPSYMSPEQARGEGNLVDGRSDVFSLGVVLYELLTGINPFRAENWAKSVSQIATVEAKPLRQIDDLIPKELESICLKALSKRPTDRFPTARDFADELRQFLKHAKGPIRGEAQMSDSPRVFGVGIKRLSHGQFGCALVIGTLVLLLAALPQFFQHRYTDTQPRLKIEEVAGKDAKPPRLQVQEVQSDARPREYRPAAQPLPPSEPPAPALPRRSRLESSPQIAKKDQSTDVVRAQPSQIATSTPSQHATTETPSNPGAFESQPRPSPTASETLAKSKLSELGLRVSHSGLSLRDEKELASAFAEVNTLKRKLVAVTKQQQAAQQGIDELQDNLREHLRANVELSAQLANVPRSNVSEHNRLVGMVNANSSAINLLMQEQEQSKKDIDLVRKESNAARESYVQQVARIRSLVEHLTGQYTELQVDSNAQSALSEWNSAANTRFEIKPSTYFLSSVKRLEALEKNVISEKIPLRREGNSYYATIVINGKSTQEMIVDTGAASVVLPYKVAVECGVNPDESSVTVIATTADRSKVKSKLVVLDSVRIGKFTAERVDAIILPREAKNAPLLLGMTFLSRFNFSINGTELVLSKINGEPDHSKDSKKSSKTR